MKSKSPYNDGREYSKFRLPNQALEYIAAHYRSHHKEVLDMLKIWDMSGDLDLLSVTDIYMKIEKDMGLDIHV